MDLLMSIGAGGPSSIVKPLPFVKVKATLLAFVFVERHTTHLTADRLDPGDLDLVYILGQFLELGEGDRRQGLRRTGSKPVG